MLVRRFAVLCALLVALVAPLGVVHPQPAAAVSRLTITLKCTSTPERTSIKNNTTARIKIISVSSLVQLRANEPITVNHYLDPGKTVTFQSGPNTTGNTISRQYIYQDSNPNDGVKVVTNRDTFTKKCPAPSSGGSTGGGGGSGGSVSVSVNCIGNPETVRVTNGTNASITIRTIGSLYQPRNNEPFSIGASLGAGKSRTYEAGAAADSNVLTHQYIFANNVGSDEGARVVTNVGTVTKRC